MNQKKEIKKTLKSKKRNKNFKTSEVVFLIVTTCIISLIVGWSISNNSYLKSNRLNNNNSKDKELSEFIKNYQYILDNYYDDVDSKTLLDGATEGMVGVLDEQSTVIPDEYSDSFNIRLEGTYKGIGIEIINDKDKNIIVYSVIENSPAEKAGLRANDIILKVNGYSFENKKTSELTKYIQKSTSDTFEVVIKREQEEKTIKIKRNKVTLKSVSSKTITSGDKKIGYINISIFANDTYNQFKKELVVLEKAKIDSLIIDVRDNIGGHLTTVSKILSLLLDKDHVIYQIKTKKTTEKVYSKGKETKKFKIVVLQNENSASASELLSATLKEEYGAVIVGTKSYGKGTVQELVKTSTGNEYKFTTKKWLTPKGNWIHKKGITPDVNVELSDEYKNNPIEENDNQYNKAIEEAIKKS